VLGVVLISKVIELAQAFPLKHRSVETTTPNHSQIIKSKIEAKFAEM
jgi:hypothetical protein